MCNLSIAWVGVSQQAVRVLVLADGADCAEISVTLTLTTSPGSTLSVQTRPAFRIQNTRFWEAVFGLSREERAAICTPRWEGNEFQVASYHVKASCPTCPEPAIAKDLIECCPSLELLDAVEDGTCQDPAGLGVLQRMLIVRWSVSRNNAEGRIISQAAASTLEAPVQTMVGVLENDDPTVLNDQSGVFRANFLLMPGQPISLNLKILTPEGCESIEERTLPAMEACTCEGHPPSTAGFGVFDNANGADLTATVAGGGCIAATTVRVTAPSDARTGRFEWLSPAVADPNDPFATVVPVPDTDAGVTVTARMGSRPCQQDRSITVTRCQRRPGFCARTRLHCGVMETSGVLFFYAFLCCLYLGLVLLAGASTKLVVVEYLTKATQTITAGGGGAAGSATYGAGTAVAGTLIALVEAYSTVSRAVVAWSSTIGLCLVGLSCICLIMSLWSFQYWRDCCAKRIWWCRFLGNLHWILLLFAPTAVLIGAAGGMVAWALGLEWFGLAGATIAYFFLAAITGPVWFLVQSELKSRGCRTPNIWDPPFLTE